MEVLNSAIHQVLEYAATAVLATVLSAAGYVLKLLHLQLTAARDAQLRAFAREAINSTEEVVEARVKQLADRAAHTAEEKAEHKLDLAVSVLASKVPGLDRDKAMALIHEELGAISGLGASAKPVVVQAGSIAVVRS